MKKTSSYRLKVGLVIVALYLTRGTWLPLVGSIKSGIDIGGIPSLGTPRNAAADPSHTTMKGWDVLYRKSGTP